MTRTKKQPYTGSKRFAGSCRNHGSCRKCEGNRLHQAHRAEAAADEQVFDALMERLGARVLYDERYDSHFDRVTRGWVEGVCDDPACEFCKSRPKEAP